MIRDPWSEFNAIYLMKDLTDEEKWEALVGLLKEHFPDFYQTIDPKILQAKDINNLVREVRGLMHGKGFLPPAEFLSLPEEEIRRYFNEVNPQTGRRYSIPYLLPSDPFYHLRYAYYMWLKEKFPAKFQRIVNWD